MGAQVQAPAGLGDPTFHPPIGPEPFAHPALHRIGRWPRPWARARRERDDLLRWIAPGTQQERGGVGVSVHRATCDGVGGD